MRKRFTQVCLLACLSITSLHLNAQAPTALKFPVGSTNQVVKQGFGIGEVSLDYSRPTANGRTVFGDLVPYGQMWRTGANGSSKITFSHDVKINGVAVAKGTYSILTVPGKDSWQFMLNKDLNIGGSVHLYSKAEEVLNITVTPKTISEKQETFSMEFDAITNSSMNLNLAWENTQVSVKIDTEYDATLMANIEKTMARDSRPYYQAAAYYYDNKKDMNQALAWVNEAADQMPNAYWIQMLKLKIQMELKDGKGATETANKVISLAKEAKADAIAQQAEKMLEAAKKFPATKKK